MKRSPGPNTGRLIDYWLGGTHHFPADVELAENLGSFGGIPPAVIYRILRGDLMRVSAFIESQGIRKFVVFGAGIPTRANVHHSVPGARVLYTDIDPLNVELGAEILSSVADAHYVFCDATDLRTLDRSEMARFFGEPGPLGLIFIGLSALLPDEDLRRALADLYRWAPAGSYLALDCDGEALLAHPEALARAETVVAATGAGLHLRNPSIFEPLLGDWKLTTQGIVPVTLWRSDSTSPPRYEPREVFMYGCVATKP